LQTVAIARGIGGINYSTRQIVSAFFLNANRYLLNPDGLVNFLSLINQSRAGSWGKELEIPTETVVY
jgi:hypothetical protein